MFFLILKLMTRVRTGITAAIFRKSLRLSPAARERFNSGVVVNLVATDLNRFLTALNFIFALWAYPIQILVGCWLVYLVLGVPGLWGTSVLLLVAGASMVQARIAAGLRRVRVQFSDRRMGRLSEFLGAVRVIKAYGWERRISEGVSELRHREQHNLRQLALTRSVAGLANNAAPFLCIATALSLKVLRDGHIDTGDAFATIGLMLSLRYAVLTLPDTISSWLEASVGLRRILDFLNAEEITPFIEGNLAPGTIALENARVDYNKMTALRDVTLHAQPGDVIAITGAVGSGKSTLITVLAGECELTSGTLSRNGAVALVPQVPWILSDSIRNNILFGQPFDAVRFSRVIEACQLMPDLADLPHGIETEIGEQGVNLSGGQRQRLALARAAYSAAPIVLLDDPLAALDIHVSRKVCDRALKGLFTDRTVIITTHRYEALAVATRVYHLELGSLVPGKGHELDHQSDGVETQTAVQQNESAVGSFVEREERFTGKIQRSSVWAYFGEFFAHGYWCWLVLAFLGYESARISMDLFVVRATGSQLGLNSFVLPYLGITAALCLMAFCRALAVNLRGVRVATRFHDRLLLGVVRAPLAFFDRTPRGRILNRFSRDIDQLDETVPGMTFEVAACSTAMVFQLGFFLYFNVYTVIPIVFCAIAYFIAQAFYRPGAREALRLDSITRSPIYSLLAESMQGLPIIRSYRSQQNFLRRIQQDLMLNARAYMTIVGCNRLVGVTIENCSVLIIASIVFLTLLDGSVVAPAMVALTLIYALNFNSLMNWLMRTASMLENGLTSAERIKFYADQQSEAYSGLKPKNFPQSGSIEINDLAVRYRPELPLVLSNFSLTVAPGQRVALLGRTGCGKSTVFQSILRLVEPCEGTLKIDGIDCQNIDLETLRHSIAIIPQEPVIFAGSIRFNIDPFNERGDQEISEIISAIQLAHLITSLDFQLTEGGTNVSFGQRQLICLGRAMARRSRILLMDEATSGVDRETDALMQQLIRQHFADSTILAIAHRPETVADYDRHIIMEQPDLRNPDANSGCPATKQLNAP